MEEEGSATCSQRKQLEALSGAPGSRRCREVGAGSGVGPRRLECRGRTQLGPPWALASSSLVLGCGGGGGVLLLGTGSRAGLHAARLGWGLGVPALGSLLQGAHA